MPNNGDFDLLSAVQRIKQHYPHSTLYTLTDLADAVFLAWCELQQLPSELQHSAAKRQQEFLAGRYCAARALQQLGQPELDMLGRQPNGSPAWPAGYNGSITHHRGRAVAWVAPSTHYRELGLDLEGVVCLARAQQLQRRVLNPAELQFGERLGYPPALWFSLLFSCKETVYKLLSHAAGRYMPFNSVEIIALEQDVTASMLRLTCRLNEDWSVDWPCAAQVSVSALLLDDGQSTVHSADQTWTQATHVLSYAALAASTPQQDH
ncbi:MAG: 4'-phosphopantetheinyl transferase superfamily protein [Moraxellaceae bacterium]